jgi:2-(1,2-epoxy-1,2-dihydrophenyl)acetyl-CoA isomerase
VPDVGDLLRNRYHPIIEGIRELPKPVVAAVNGPAVGIGCSLALACDLIWAAESAIFGLAFVNIGLIPDGGSTFLVPAAVGKARALEMALLGEPVAAQQACDWGLINRVVPDGKLVDETRSLVARLATGPTRSYANSKRALNNSVLKIMHEQLELEANIQSEMAATTDFIEGVRAFVEKREPAFTGG